MTAVILSILGIWAVLIVVKEFAFDQKVRKQFYAKIHQVLDNIIEERTRENEKGNINKGI